MWSTTKYEEITAPKTSKSKKRYYIYLLNPSKLLLEFVSGSNYKKFVGTMIECLCCPSVLLIVAVSAAFIWWYTRPARCHSKARLDGKTAIVTGSNTGIGKETAKDFASRGADVIIACRDVTKGETAAEDIRKSTGNKNVHVRKLDLSSLKSVHEFSKQILKEFPKLHILVNNAGLMFCPFMLTEDGFEMQFGVMHLGHFALTNLLLPRLRDSGTKESTSRVINVSSIGHKLFGQMELDDLLWKKNEYSPYGAYGTSKLANVLMAVELHQRLGDDGRVSFFSLHPGAVMTELMRYWSSMEFLLKYLTPLMRLHFKTAEEGAQTTVQCAVAEDMDQYSGEYFAECKVENKNRSQMSRDLGLAKKLWEKSEELTGVNYPL